MNKRAKKNLTIISIIIIVIILIFSAYTIYQNSLNNRIIDVTIEVDKSSYSVNETITFTLTLEDTSARFSIDELADGAGFCIVRIPDDIDPNQIVSNRTYLQSLCTYPVERIGISGYSEDDKTYIITWNCTYDLEYNLLTGAEGDDVYYLAPSGYYVMFRSNLQSWTNDNQLRFNLNENSVFYLDGLTPTLSCEYDNQSSSLDIQLLVEGGSYENGTALSVQTALYRIDKSSMNQMVFYDQVNVSWNGSFSLNYTSSVSFSEGEWLRVYVTITTPQGRYSSYWADYQEESDE